MFQCNPRNPNQHVAFVMRVTFVCVQTRHVMCGTVFMCVKYATTPCNCWACHHLSSCNEPMKFLVDMLNYAHWLRIGSVAHHRAWSTGTRNVELKFYRCIVTWCTTSDSRQCKNAQKIKYTCSPILLWCVIVFSVQHLKNKKQTYVVHWTTCQKY